ncbi:MAG TPA: YdcF family protein, partial [Polyangiaceae bacterium]
HAALRRVERAIEAYRAEGAALVIASGGKTWAGFQECKVFASGLVSRGIPAQHVLEETDSLTTRGNARGVAALLRDRELQRVGLVTCDFHMPRALRLFQRAGLSPIPVPARSPARPFHSALFRSVRERASLALDLLLGPLLLALALSGCTKPSAQTHGGTQRAASPAASISPQKLTSLLQAELRRDPSVIADDDLIAEDAERRLAAVRSLARIADERSLASLEKALADEDPRVIGWAAFGVGQLCRGHEPEAARHLALRAASLAQTPSNAERDRALGSLSLGLGRCASDEAEKTLRAWLKLKAPFAESASLGLGQVARQRKHLDEATVAALLDAVAETPDGALLYPIESLPALGPAARQRLLEVASKALEQQGPGRAFAVRALAKAGAEAAGPLRHLLEAETTNDAERADIARSLAALGGGGQAELALALKGRARALIDGKAWLSSQHGVVLTLLEGLEPKSGDAGVLLELSQLPLQGEPAPVARRKIMLRCRAAALLANRATESSTLAACDPAPLAERREGSLALLKVLGRGALSKSRGARFAELARSTDRVVREAALELLLQHDEAPSIPELLASALSAKEVGVQATAAKVLSRYPSRAQVAPDAKSDAANPA